jgi:hypothetical protein
MPAAANGNEQLVVAAEVNGADYICGICAARDYERLLVDHAVVEGASLVVAWVIGLDELTTQISLEACDFCSVEHVELPLTV